MVRPRLSGGPPREANSLPQSSRTNCKELNRLLLNVTIVSSDYGRQRIQDTDYIVGGNWSARCITRWYVPYTRFATMCSPYVGRGLLCAGWYATHLRLLKYDGPDSFSP